MSYNLNPASCFHLSNLLRIFKQNDPLGAPEVTDRLYPFIKTKLMLSIL